MKLVLTARASKDFNKAVDYYTPAGQSARFAGELELVFMRLGEFPESGGKILGHHVRRAIVRDFPYNVFYRVLKDRIAVLHIRHSSRTPWRLP